MYIADVTNIDTVSTLNMDPTCHARKDILKGLSENNYIHGKHMHLNRVFHQSFQDDNYLGAVINECIANISDVVEDIVFPQ